MFTSYHWKALWSNIPLIFLGRLLYLLISSSWRWRCFEWAHQCSRQRYCLKLSMNTLPLNIIEWHLFLLVVSAVTSWFLSDWQLGLCCSGWTATRSGDCSEAGLGLNSICLECISSVKGTTGKSMNVFKILISLFYLSGVHNAIE